MPFKKEKAKLAHLEQATADTRGRIALVSRIGISALRGKEIARAEYDESTKDFTGERQAGIKHRYAWAFNEVVNATESDGYRIVNKSGFEPA